MGYRNFLIIALTMLALPLAHGQVMKCVDSKGNITFSDGGCNSGYKSSTVDVKPAMGGDKPMYRSRNQYSNNYEAYDNYSQEEKYTAYSMNNQKQAKYAADRQAANAYDEGIKRQNDERMRNMNSSYPITNTASSTGQRTCSIATGHMRCY